MRIVVTGGAGLIGRTVVDRLAAGGHEVISLVRRPSSGRAPENVTELIGDVSDVSFVDRSLAGGVDAVVHLAAIPSPQDKTAVDLVTANALTTLTVLEGAGRHRVPTVVMASSISVLGMAWSEDVMPPLYLPVDEDHPLRPTEGYGLSKEMDEASARFAARRWGTTVIAMRFPFTGTEAMIRQRLSQEDDPDMARTLAKELWAYLDVRDAATAVENALDAAYEARIAGALVLNVMAADVLSATPVRELAARWYPEVPIGEGLLDGAYDTNAAHKAIAFHARHLLRRSPDKPSAGEVTRDA